MIKTINSAKNRIGFSVISVSKNISSNKSNNEKLFLNNNHHNNNCNISTFNNSNNKNNKNIKLYTTNSISYLNNHNNNHNNNKNQITRNYYTVNSKFHKRYDIMQSITQNDIYRILNDVSMSSYHKTATIRISFFNQDKDKCDIKGVKLYGNNTNNGGGWIVIVGSHDSSQWNNIALSLYLSTLFADRPLKNFDVVIFPVENPQPITSVNTARRNAIMMSNTLNQIQQSGNSSTLTSSSSSSSSKTTASSSSLSSLMGSSIPTSLDQDNNIFYNFDSNLLNGLEYNTKTKGNHALSEWLKKYKKDFELLKINKDYSIQVNNKSSSKETTLSGFFNANIDQFGFSNNNSTSLVLDESNEDVVNTQSNLPNFILNIKDFNISPNFSAEELYSLGSGLATQLNDIDKMYSFKKLSPMGF